MVLVSCHSIVGFRCFWKFVVVVAVVVAIVSLYYTPCVLYMSFLFFQGELDSAESEVRYILAHDVYSTDAEFVLGRILELKGSLKEARYYFHRVLKKDYRHSGARDALQRLDKKSMKI